MRACARWLYPCVVLVGCGTANSVAVERMLVPAAPDPVVARIGTRASTDLVITNSGTAAGRVDISIDAPFETVVDFVVVQPEQSARVALYVTPKEYGQSSAFVDVVGNGWSTRFDVTVLAPSDFDGDGFVDAGAGGPDCDDGDNTIHPDAEDVCDRVDNDCDGTPDNDRAYHRTFYDDLDGDGYGDPARPKEACFLGPRQSTRAEDCDDADEDRHPLATERTDGQDQDCDGLIDEHLWSVGGLTVSEVFLGDSATVQRYAEVLVTSGLRVHLGAASIQSLSGADLAPLPGLFAEDHEVLLICEGVAPQSMAGRDCDVSVSAFPADGVQLAARTGAGPATLILDRLDWTAFRFPTDASLELKPDRLRADRNDAITGWCSAEAPFEDIFGSPGTVDAHCGAAE